MDEITQREDSAAAPLMAPIEVSARDASTPASREVVFEMQRPQHLLRRDARGLRGVNMQIYKNVITAMIGPSGCGKSTVLRSLNRMNDSITGLPHHRPGALPRPRHLRLGRRPGRGAPAHRHGLPAPEPVPQVDLRQHRVGAADPRHASANLNERIEKALRGAALWDEVKDRLKQSALGLSGGQQQRLCIARAIAIEPDVLLLDEPASALDPISTASIEELMHTLKREYTLVIVTHNMQQAARVAERTAFFSLDVTDGKRNGVLVEYDDTEKLFTRPADKRTEDYVTGRFG